MLLLNPRITDFQRRMGHQESLTLHFSHFSKMDSETSYVNSKLRQLICDSAGLRPWLFIFPPKKCVQLFVSIYNNATSLEIDQRMLPFILT